MKTKNLCKIQPGYAIHIAGGAFLLSAGTDGLHTENSDDETRPNQMGMLVMDGASGRGNKGGFRG